MKKRIVFVIALLCIAAVSLQKVHASTITVTNANDGAPPIPGSLRWALAVVNDGDTINFDPSVTGAITLTSGELLVNKSVTIAGLGANVLAVDGNFASRVFHIAPGKTVTISGLTIRNGLVNGHDGGGIYNQNGTLSVINATLRGNRCSGLGEGGGIYNFGSLRVSNCTITDNGVSNGNGGGIYDPLRSRAVVSSAVISNSTISRNDSSLFGGGICVIDGPVRVSNCTISDNVANFGGGIYNRGYVEIGGTILKKGASGSNIYDGTGGILTSLGYNLCSDNGNGLLMGPGDQINTNPMLGPLQNNGGPTLTQALLPGSPAINAGNPSFTPPPEFDQRGPGYPRVVNGRIDVGAFEVQ